MRPLTILILSDGRPGHYHLAEGVVAAIGRKRAVNVRTIAIDRRRATPGRLLAVALGLGVPPRVVVRTAYGSDLRTWGGADLIVSAGGDTLAANVSAARALGAPNIFCGTLRHFAPEAFALVISSYARHAGMPRHLVALKPNGIDPDKLSAQAGRSSGAIGAPPQVAGLLVGGPSGLFHWRDDEWERLASFLEASWLQLGLRWVVSTSRRTPDAMADRLQNMTEGLNGPIEDLIDFRIAGPGTLPRLFGRVDAILATEDSSTMLSEAVCARLPVIGVSPERHTFKDEEAEYRAFLTSEGWCRSVPLAHLTPSRFLEALREVRPLRENHLDKLAESIAERLPELFSVR